MNIINLKDIVVSYNSRNLFHHFNLEVRKGDKVRIKGKSGSGKTTLFKILLGFVRPDTGEVLFDGKPLDSKMVWEVRRSIAYVSQDMNIGEGLVKEFLQEVFSYESNRALKIEKDDILSAFSKFSLSDELYESRISDLSGGEKQRVAIVASILIDRQVYLLDEVTSALDETLKRKIANYFLALEDKTVLIVSHDTVWELPHVKLIDLDNNN